MWDEVAAGLEAVFAVAGRPATYTRGATAKSVTVLPGNRNRHNSKTEQPVQFEDGEFILKLSELAELGLPLNGDTITTEFGDRSKIFALQDRPDGTKSWDYVPGNLYARLHSTLTSDT